MKTLCNPPSLSLHPHSRRRVEACFDAHHVSSDGGLLLVREFAQQIQIFSKIAACFTDYRDPSRIEHSLEELLAQRIYGIMCGYEDISDHAQLRLDPLLALAAGKSDVLGKSRRHALDHGKPLASPATLHRLELGSHGPDPFRPDLKFTFDETKLEALFVDLFLETHEKPDGPIILDVDATDDEIHGEQEGRFFHGYYGNYCYLPLYLFCGDALLCAKLRRSNIDGAAGALDEVKRVVAQIHERWPDVEIWLRGDSGFCRDELLSWCEATPGVEYIVGLSKNARLVAEIEDHLVKQRELAEAMEKPMRMFTEFTYETLDSWSCSRRVVSKVEALVGKDNPRFVVTSLPTEIMDAVDLYQKVYCARGDMENRIKEQQLGMFADRTSSHTMRANQLRLWFSSLAYILLDTFRRMGLRGTEMARAQVWTIRNRILKVGAIFTQSVRRIRVSLSKAYPWAHIWEIALENLRNEQANFVF
jgi:hypothetical protein